MRGAVQASATQDFVVVYVRRREAPSADKQYAYAQQQ